MFTRLAIIFLAGLFSSLVLANSIKCPGPEDWEPTKDTNSGWWSGPMTRWQLKAYKKSEDWDENINGNLWLASSITPDSLSTANTRQSVTVRENNGVFCNLHINDNDSKLSSIYLKKVKTPNSDSFQLKQQIIRPPNSEASVYDPGELMSYYVCNKFTTKDPFNDCWLEGADA